MVPILKCDELVSRRIPQAPVLIGDPQRRFDPGGTVI
jgi:hypothetical protein